MMAMKRARVMAGAVLVLVPWFVRAAMWTDSATGIRWTYKVNKGAVTIGIGNQSAIATSTKGALSIPSQIANLPVTRIGDEAFRGCRGLTSVTIPSSVTRIGKRAFWDCSGLTRFLVDENNPSYRAINGLLLTKDGKTLVCGVKGDVEIPSGVTRIGDEAFRDCSWLTSVTIPSGVTSIGDAAFYWCSGLKSVTIPSSVTSIGYRAFEDCSGLTSVTIPSGVTRIDDGAFIGCSGLTRFFVDENNPNYRAINGLLLTKDGKTLVCGVKGDVEIPSHVTSIGYRAFWDCSGLKSVTIPSSVTHIGYRAFKGCSGLKSVTIPSSVTSIGDEAFAECSGLTSVTIPSGVTHIGDRAFSWCSGLSTVYVDAGDASRVQTLLSNSRCATSDLTFVGVQDRADPTAL